MSTAPDLTQHDDSGAAPDDETQRWNLTASDRRHRVDILGSATRTVTWYVDDQLVATKKSSQDDLHLEPGQGSDPHDSIPEQADVGTIRVKFSAVGRTKRVTWCEEPHRPHLGDLARRPRALRLAAHPRGGSSPGRRSSGTANRTRSKRS